MSRSLAAQAEIDSSIVASLRSAVDREAIFLTPNTRLSRHVKELLRQLFFSGEATSSEFPEVIPFDSWSMAHRNALLVSARISPRALLKKHQDLVFWERVVSSSQFSEALISPFSAAQQAQQAYQLLRQWQVDIEQNVFEFSSALDSRALLHWQRDYQRQLAEAGQIGFVDAQCELLTAKALPQKKPLVLLGFQSPTPLQRALVAHFSPPDMAAEEVSLRSAESEVGFASYPDRESELRAAADWAENLSRHAEGRVAVVVQDLSSCRAEVERIFLQAFEPSALRTGGEASATSYNLSAGVPLSQTATVSVALDLLEAAVSPLSRTRWLGLLSSPYLAGEDISFRRQMMADCYAAGEAEYSFRQIIRLPQWSAARRRRSLSQHSDFYQRLQKVVKFLAELRPVRSASPSQWLLSMRQLWAIFSCPGERSLNSEEYQQWQQFIQCVDEFSSFDPIVGEVSFSRAVSLFRRHCEAKVFHRQSLLSEHAACRVDVLGGLEASGQIFDYLWLIGMSDQQWPPPVQPHPLIPRSLQLRLSMPAASSERQLSYAEAMTRGYLSSATEIVVSYPRQRDDIDCQLSPLCAAFLQRGVAPEARLAVPDNGFASRPLCDVHFIDFPDHYGRAYCPQRDAVDGILRGGAAVLRDQAQNPLWAYIKWRLGTQRLAEDVCGISPLERGNTIHAALEFIWRELGGSEGLAALFNSEGKEAAGDTAARLLIERALDAVLPGVFSSRFESPAAGLLPLEKENLAKRLLLWLQLECRRDDFSVAFLEHSLHCDLAGLRLNLRIDRVDRLTDGTLLLIDYKSGKTALSGWLDERLSEPQMPLYRCALTELAVADDSVPKVSAISYASLKSGAMAFNGLAVEEAAALSIKKIVDPQRYRYSGVESWDLLLAHWDVALRALAEEFLSGYAALDSSLLSQIDLDFEAVARINSSQISEQLQCAGDRFDV